MAVDGVVLVHGAVHGVWCWEPVRPLLRARSVAVDLPGRGTRPAHGRAVTIEMAVDAVLSDADEAGFDRFVLVGHSLGGVTITETANRAPDRVARAVYLSALAPKPGQGFFDASSRHDGAREDIDPTGAQPLMPEAVAHRLFAGDLDEAAFAAVYARFVPEPNGLLLARISGYSPQVPTTYIRCVRDVILPLALADGMVGNLPQPDVRDLDADHDAMLTSPTALAALLDEIAASA